MDELEDFSTLYFISGKLGKLYVYIPYILLVFTTAATTDEAEAARGVRVGRRGI